MAVVVTVREPWTTGPDGTGRGLPEGGVIIVIRSDSRSRAARKRGHRCYSLEKPRRVRSKRAVSHMECST